MSHFTGPETIRFLRWLEMVLKRELNVADVQIIVEMDPDLAWSDDNESLLETTEGGSKNRSS